MLPKKVRFTESQKETLFAIFKYLLDIYKLFSYSQTFFLILYTDVLDWYEVFHVSSWRQKSLDLIFEHICADDTFTNGISIGPVGLLLHFYFSSVLKSTHLLCKCFM